MLPGLVSLVFVFFILPVWFDVEFLVFSNVMALLLFAFLKLMVVARTLLDSVDRSVKAFAIKKVPVQSQILTGHH